MATEVTSRATSPTRPKCSTQARAARQELRSCVVAAADVVDAAPNDEDASAKLLRCARALSTAAADLHPVGGEPEVDGRAARVMKDAGGFILRALKGGICPAASTATAGLGLLRAEFVRRYDAQQVWVDGVDCWRRAALSPESGLRMTRRRRRHRRTAAAVRRRDQSAVAQPIATVLFSPNAVYTSPAAWLPVMGRPGSLRMLVEVTRWSCLMGEATGGQEARPRRQNQKLTPKLSPCIF